MVDHAVAVRLDGERPILHSDHGSQNTSIAYRNCLEGHQLTMSMGQVRTYVDNASGESLFPQLKRERVYRSRFRTRQEAAAKIDRYFLTIYNPLRRVSLTRAELEHVAALDDDGNEEINVLETITNVSPETLAVHADIKYYLVGDSLRSVDIDEIAQHVIERDIESLSLGSNLDLGVVREGCPNVAHRIREDPTTEKISTDSLHRVAS